MRVFQFRWRTRGRRGLWINRGDGGAWRAGNLAECRVKLNGSSRAIIARVEHSRADMRVHPSLSLSLFLSLSLSLSAARRVKVSLDVKASVDVPHYRTRCHFWQIDPRFFFVRSSASHEPTAVDDDRETTPKSTSRDCLHFWSIDAVWLIPRRVIEGDL